MTDTAISVQNVGKCYRIYDRPHDRLKQMFLYQFGRRYGREFWALKDVSFEVKKGESVGIIGRNGSGKSTLLQIIAGTLQPTTGSVQVNGRVAALLELGSGFNPEYTGRENVYMNASILGLTRAETDARFDEIAAFADIGQFLDQPVKTYSSGMMVRLAFAVQTAVNPDILIVDEALSVGDVFFQQKCFSRVRGMLKAGTTLLFVSHDTAAVQNLCATAVLLEKGAPWFTGSPVEATSLYYLMQTKAAFKNTLATSVQLKSESVDESSVEAKELNILTNNILSSGNANQGEKELELLAVTAQNENGDYTLEIPVMSTVTIQVLMVAHRYIQMPNFGFTLIDRMNTVIFSSSSWHKGYKLKPMLPEEKRIVTFKICLSVQPGEYSFALGCAEINPLDMQNALTLNRILGLGPLVVIKDPNTISPFGGIANLKMEVLLGNDAPAAMSHQQNTDHDYSMHAYSLEGEDLILWRLLKNKSAGFYVDIGACHPCQYSNTHFFYCHGWHGINVDATPGSMALFKKHRPKDINIETVVSSHAGSRKFYMFAEPALNSCDGTLSMDRASRGNKIINTVEVASRTLSNILSTYIPPNAVIDFMNIDVEGSELDVLQSNDWTRFKPLYIMVEISAFGKKNGFNVREIITSEVGKYLQTAGYELAAKTFDTAIYSIQKSSPNEC